MEISDDDGKTALYLAVEHRHKTVALVMLGRLGSLEKDTGSHMPVLLAAAEQGHDEFRCL
eukprot:56150-Eustigmatos_ZCMA.PRE.1